MCGAGRAHWHTIREKDTEAVRSSSNLLSGKSGTFNVKNITVNVIIVIYSCRMNGRRSLTHWLWITLLFRKDNGVYTAQSFTREYLSFLLTSAFFSLLHVSTVGRFVSSTLLNDVTMMWWSRMACDAWCAPSSSTYTLTHTQMYMFGACCINETVMNFLN